MSTSTATPSATAPVLPCNIVTTDLQGRFTEARLALNTHFPFFGYLSYTLQFLPDGAEQRGVRTAAVGMDGTIVINKEFASKLSEEEFRGVLMHEVMHPAMFYFERLGIRIPKIFNIAHDYVINNMIMEYISGESCKRYSGMIKLPPNGYYNLEYSKMSAEEIYNKILDLHREQVQKQQQQNQDGLDIEDDDSGEGGNNSGGTSGGEGKDRQGKSKGGLQPVTGPTDLKDIKLDFYTQDCRRDLSSTEKGKQAQQGDSGAEREMQEFWKQKVAGAAINHRQRTGNRGDLPGSILKLIDELLNPIVTWQNYLLNYLGQTLGKVDLTYMRPNRRSEAARAVLAGTKRDTGVDLTIMWDTSGSMNGLETRILTEIDGLVQEMRLSVRVIIIDTMIHADISDIDDAMQVIPHIKGGGGSDFTPAFHKLEEEGDESVVLAFTDGMIGVPGSKPERLQDVMWVLTHPKYNRPAPWGLCIAINETDDSVTVK
jgi:predicted metal-dependent peptidase